MHTDPSFVVVVFLIIVGLALLFMWDVGRQRYCPQCVHCRQEKWIKESEAGRQKAAADARAHQDFHRVYGQGGCPWCEKENS